MDVGRIDEGLWRWTAPHPEWSKGADWEREVGCVYWESGESIVLVDPLIPDTPPERNHFLGSLDADVERVGDPVVVLLTCRSHRRSADELAGRYGGRILAPERSGADTSSVQPDVLIGTTAFAAGPGTDNELVYWLPEVRSLVVGDVLLGDDHGGVRLLPESWLSGDGGIAAVSRALEPLLELPIERVLVSHGAPVLGGGREALRAALHAG